VSSKEIVFGAFLNQPIPAQLYRAVVLSVSGLFCAVRLIHSDLEVEDVALVAEEDGTDLVIIRPKVDSLVIVGCIENDISSMYVARCGDIESVSIRIGDTQIELDKSACSLIQGKSKVLLDKNKAVLSQSDTTVELQGQKVSITNGTLTLKGLFDELATVINSLIVLTPSGPSTGLSPTSITAITSFKTKVAQLLK
jgi:hypothetical protein